ncbi:MAG: LysM peptidoglycan-binding domain-containing protein [Bacteroidetes bacterium]|nr:LysM peptidoglycan-binding domain-containing protein [Bacteroidota bacterium]
MERRIKYLWIILIAFLSMAGIAMAQVPVQVSQTIETYEGKAYYLHTVEAQQTLYSIAKAYGVTVEAILLNNPDARRGLRVNQVIRIPASGATAAPAQAQGSTRQAQATGEADEFEYIYHVAGKNETFAYVASVYTVPEKRIRDANPSRSEPFREGDYILIPILRKDRRPPVTESAQLRRSGFDPYNTPGQQSGPTRRDLVNAANTSAAGQTEPAASTSPAQRQTSTQAQTTPATPPRQSSSQPQPNAGNTAQAAQTNVPQSRPLMPESVPSNAVEQTRPERHIVRPQETLYSIARNYNLTVAQLQQANPGLTENIQVGQVLLLPSSAIPQSAVQQNVEADEIVIHTVARGETLFRISRNYGVTIEELKRFNPGLTESLATGQQIRVPKKKIIQSYLIHQVDKQQRTRQLARDYGLTTEELQQANPSIGKNVFPKQEVKIPLQTKPSEARAVVKHPEPLMPHPQAKKEKEVLHSDDIAEQQPDPVVGCLPDRSNEQKVYRVALLLPLYLNEVSTSLGFNGRNPASEAPRGLSFAQFYQGFLVAADSLATNFGLKTELLVLDVDQSTATVQRALADPRLRQSQLIIGPFFSQAFEQVASFARSNQIPIINPVTLRRQVVEGNPYVIKLRPDQSSLFNQLAITLTNTYPEAGVIVLHAPGRNQAEAEQVVRAFEQHIASRPRVANADILRALSARSSGPAFINAGGKYIDLAELRARSWDSTRLERKVQRMAFDRNDLGRFREMADTWRNNIVVVYSDDRAYAMEVLNRLNQVADQYNIQLVGLPDWRRFDNLFTEHLVRLNLHYTDATFVDYNDHWVRFFVWQYRERFGIEPNSYAFEGFDTGWYFLQMLMRHGNAFLPCLPDFHIRLMTNSFRFVRTGEENGFENQNWNISRVRDYRFEPLEMNR